MGISWLQYATQLHTDHIGIAYLVGLINKYSDTATIFFKYLHAVT